MRSPVLFQIFNRPDIVRRAFAGIRAARPPRLYVAADGPRPDKPGEAALCAEARRLALEVDWPCRVETLFNEENLGVPLAIQRAYNWFFSREAEGVILEEDILAHRDFFNFCDALLERYRNDKRIFSINGGNFQMGLRRGAASYYFSIFPHSWGWASWARAWEHYDPAMSGCRVFMTEVFPDQCGSRDLAAFFLHGFEETISGDALTWDNQWTYAVFRNKGLCAVPQRNLTVNLGFERGGHFDSPPSWGHVRLEGLSELSHPETVKACREADLFSFEVAHLGINFFALINEGYRRINEGEASSNHELIRLLRLFFSDNSELAKLETFTFLAEGDLSSALAALSRAQAAHSHAREDFTIVASKIAKRLRR